MSHNKTAAKIELFLEQAETLGHLICPKCFNIVSSDSPKCYNCGDWSNVLVDYGYF